jgi:carbohydrate kinase (thermoresistant glucokinase family)
MGVSGSGKSTVGEALAAELGVPFLDSDSLHPLTNVDKMAAGIPLTDDDRWPWLRAVGNALARADDTGLVIACSALKRSYRNMIRSEEPSSLFVYLTGSRELLAERLSKREDHFMPPSLLDSQLATLEPLGQDEMGVVVDIADAPKAIANSAASAIRAMR